MSDPIGTITDHSDGSTTVVLTDGAIARICAAPVYRARCGENDKRNLTIIGSIPIGHDAKPEIVRWAKILVKDKWTSKSVTMYPPLDDRLGNQNRAIVAYVDDQPIVSKDKFPHICTRCKAPAYIGFMNTECSKGCQ